ncbi:TonB-dependent receptor plug domain-containing protein [Rhodanobacter sp. AS-Z3]|uniref:TonB-dependent receptor n=1 Tax=Rhodanobacter sp. AS-Z3 TaxID=3031330 RepID=UPI00247B15FA|nr:TonB-dependent receptor plug domain-containing protein [Rhodanobacter sp. AS-Z3]WEN14659.1 TonB-dependent receptor plug domain-containing protein [Rhodanobacter sp. AS-Z3]
MSSHKAWLAKGAVYGLLALLSVTAVAQDASQDGVVQTTKVQKAKPSATDLKPVTVTVELRSQSLQKYAGTAQALNSDDLRGMSINSVKSLQTAVPGLSVANQEGNVEIFIRGVGSANSTELGDPAVAPHLNGDYIPRPRGLGLMFYDLDRVEVNKGPQGTLRGRNALGGTLNIVTKQPELGVLGGYVQGEMGNANSHGAEGAFNIPLGEKSALRISGYALRKGTNEFNNAGTDQRLKPAGLQKEGDVRVSLLSKPTDRLSIFLMADYGHEGGTGYPGANIYSATQAGYFPGEFDMRKVVYRGPQGTLDNHIWGVQTKIDYRFDPFNVEYSGSYRSVRFAQTNAASDGVMWPGRNVSAQGEDYDVWSDNYWQTRSKATTHQLLLTSPEDSALVWTLGGFYFKENQQVGYLALVDKGYCCYSGTEFTMPKVPGRSHAFFGDMTFPVTDRLRLKIGARHTEETKQRIGIGGNWALTLGGDGYSCCFATRLGTDGFAPSLLDRPSFDVADLTTNAQKAKFLIDGVLKPGARDTLLQQLAGVVDGSHPNGQCVDRPDTNNGGAVTCPPNGENSFLNLTIPGPQRGSSKFNYNDFRTGFEFDVTDKNLLYGTVSTGHKSGGFNDSFDPTVIPSTYKPEKMVAWELGSKNQFELGGHPGLFNASGFYYNYTDQVFQDLTTIAVDQFGQATGFSLVNRNVAKSKLYGAELQSTLRFDHGFMLDLNALMLHSEIVSGTVADTRSQNFAGNAGGITSLIDLKGNQLPLASKFWGAARLQQYIDLGQGTFDWQTLVSYRSAYYLSQYNLDPVVFVKDNLGTVDRVEGAAAAGFPDQQKGFFTVNLGLGFTPNNSIWRFEGYVSNLFNKQASQKALIGSGINVRFLNDARAFGIRARAEF